MVAPALRDRVARELPAWRVEGEQLAGEWRYADFAQALAATVHVGLLAERADHHPDIALSWGRLEVRLTTHSAASLTERDVDLAVAIERAIGAPAR